MKALDDRTKRLAARLGDERSRRVVFVAHCLLNQNVRYLGGAAYPGIVPPAIERFVREGTGLYQMPCPEQNAWGGVMKRFVLRFYGAERTWLYRVAQIAFPIFVLYTRWRYWRLARRVAKDIADYARSGFEIAGVVGVGDSPSCGVSQRLDMRRSLPVVASVDVDRIEPRAFNERVVRRFIVEGEGLYTRALRKQLRRQGVAIPFSEYEPFSAGESTSSRSS